MLNVLAQGSLVADPIERKTMAGKPFATGSLRVPCEDGEPVLISLITFRSAAIEALLALKKGDPLAVVGRAKLADWQKDGADHRGLNVVGDQVLTIYQAERRRQATTEQGDE